MPERIRLSRARGWRLPEGAVNVARPGRLGNPFIVGKHGTRRQCAAKFWQLAHGFISLGEGIEIDVQLELYRHLRRIVKTLRGKDIACWCALDGEACHGDVLLALANPRHPKPEWMLHPVDIGRPRLGMLVNDLERVRRDALAKAAAK